MISQLIFWIFFASGVIIQDPPKENLVPDPCNIYGVVYIESNKRRADYIVFEEETEAFADVNIFQEENKLLADDQGLWHFTDRQEFADFTIYFESEASRADFSIFFTDQIAYAGCK